MSQTPRRLDIHRALSRPSQLLGADRELVLLSALVTVILIFVVLTPLAALLGSALWVLVLGLLRSMARTDPLLRQVYLRHIRYRSTYAARPTAWVQGGSKW